MDACLLTKTAEEVTNKLSEFGLSLSGHIVAVVADGVSAMVNFGRLLTVNIICAMHMLYILLFVTFCRIKRHLMKLTLQKESQVPKLMLKN